MAKVIQWREDAPLPPETLTELATAARSCKILVFPTDTVYGIGSTGLIKAASRRIYEIKNRDSMKPLPILVHSAEEAWRWVQPTPEARSLARAFWPGPMTLVLRPTPEGRRLTLPEFSTLAIRVSGHPLVRAMIEASGIPWASTSANASGSPAIQDGTEAASMFSGTVDYVIEGGRCAGVESSVVDACTQPVRVLREGRLSREELLRALN